MIDFERDLRDYQRQCIQSLRQGFQQGHKHQILMAPTGSGKTMMAAYMIQEAVRKKKRVSFVVDRVNLVNQTSRSFDEFKIHHGVVQAQHWRRNDEYVQIVSIQTIEKRGFFPQTDLLIVDECHDTREFTTKFLAANKQMPSIGLSATPFKKGLGKIYTNLVSDITTDELVPSFLSPLKIYAAKAVDMKGARVVAGEWAPGEIEQRGKTIVCDIVSEWIDKTKKHFGGPVKTIVFSATVSHGRELCEQFQAAGYNFQQISYEDKDKEGRRDELIEEFRKPDSEIVGLVSCEVFTKGFDVPDIMCGIAARPYRKSLSSHIQQLGRVMRRAPGKEFGLWLDHCGNVLRFKEDTDDIFANGLSSLDSSEKDAVARKEPSEKEKKQMSCSCGYVFPHFMPVCPACGNERKKPSEVEVVDGTMEEVEVKTPSFMRDRKAVWRQLVEFSLQRKKGDISAAQRFAKAQYKQLYGQWPKNDSMSESQPIGPELAGRVQHNLIKFFKGRSK